MKDGQMKKNKIYRRDFIKLSLFGVIAAILATLQRFFKPFRFRKFFDFFKSWHGIFLFFLASKNSGFTCWAEAVPST